MICLFTSRMKLVHKKLRSLYVAGPRILPVLRTPVNGILIAFYYTIIITKCEFWSFFWRIDKRRFLDLNFLVPDKLENWTKLMQNYRLLSKWPHFSQRFGGNNSQKAANIERFTLCSPCLFQLLSSLSYKQRFANIYKKKWYINNTR